MFDDLRSRVSLPQLALILIGGAFVLRLALVVLSPLELYADEAQYWRWSESFAWGYYSKPPMIAWVIGASTAIFGDVAWAVRVLAPVFHAITAIVLWWLSRRMFDDRAAFFTVLTYVMMPGVVLSSSVISTDGVLFPFWALSLYLFWRLREDTLGWVGAVGLGVAVGLGFLSKYAMLYFLIGAALTLALDSRSQRLLTSAKAALALCAFVLVLLPHLVWNAQNGFETVGHTVDNANLSGQLFNLDHFPRFIGDQMGVFGPVAFVLIFVALFFRRPAHLLADMGNESDSASAKQRWLACFILPVLVIIAAQAVLSRAHANWAATAYPAASVLVGAFVARAPIWRRVFWAGLVLQLVLALLAAILSLGPVSWSAALGRDNDFKRVRGWQDISAQLMAEVDQLQPTVIVTDEREVWHGLDYYTRDSRSVPLVLWRYNAGPKNFAEKQDLADLDDSRVLVASYRSHFRPRIQADFATWEPVGSVQVDLGHRSNGCPLDRELRLYLVSGYTPLERNSDWVRRFKTQSESGAWVNTHIDRPPVCPPVPETED